MLIRRYMFGITVSWRCPGRWASGISRSGTLICGSLSSFSARAEAGFTRALNEEGGAIMLTVFGANHRLCDGVSRRGFLKVGALGVGALTLADWLRARAHASAPTSAKAIIMVYLNGGPSHMDMYDMKPDAPVEYRGEFRPIRTNVPGIDVCEHLPLQA